jgi:hypothetical protein
MTVVSSPAKLQHRPLLCDLAVGCGPLPSFHTIPFPRPGVYCMLHDTWHAEAAITLRKKHVVKCMVLGSPCNS